MPVLPSYRKCCPQLITRLHLRNISALSLLDIYLIVGFIFPISLILIKIIIFSIDRKKRINQGEERKRKVILNVVSSLHLNGNEENQYQKMAKLTKSSLALNQIYGSLPQLVLIFQTFYCGILPLFVILGHKT